MKIFLKKISILTILVSFFIFIIMVLHYNIVGSQYDKSYVAALIEKVDRLKSIDKPKIVLVGNSNLAFGICSEEIEKELKMPVVNLGLHGSLGNAFHERVAKLGIKKDDIVIVCHTNYDDESTILNYPLAWITYDCHKEFLKLFGIKDYWNLFCSCPDYLRESFYRWKYGEQNENLGVYSRSSFNKYGDIVYRPLSGKHSADVIFAEDGGEIPGINNTCIKRLNRLNKYCIAHEATLLLAGYPIAYGEYTEYTKSDFQFFQEKIEKKIDCEVISNFTDYFFPYDYFYDTKYHLTEEGAKVRTKQLIMDLKRWMEEKSHE